MTRLSDFGLDKAASLHDGSGGGRCPRKLSTSTPNPPTSSAAACSVLEDPELLATEADRGEVVKETLGAEDGSNRLRVEPASTVLENQELVGLIVRELVRGAPALATINWPFCREVRSRRAGLQTASAAVLALLSVAVDEATRMGECPLCTVVPEMSSAIFCAACGSALRPGGLSSAERHVWHLTHPTARMLPVSSLWLSWLWQHRFVKHFQDHLSFFLTPPTQCPSPVRDEVAGNSTPTAAQVE